MFGRPLHRTLPSPPPSSLKSAFDSVALALRAELRRRKPRVTFRKPGATPDRQAERSFVVGLVKSPNRWRWLAHR